MGKINCWEYMKCGREPGGDKVDELGVCPAATFTAADGFCNGKNGGRACVYITGTFCNGTISGTFQEKEKECIRCDFYQLLNREHGARFFALNFFTYVKKRRD